MTKAFSFDILCKLARAKARERGEPLRAASGGNTVRGEVNRNERAPQCGVAKIEVADDQKRVMTPAEAKKIGSDYIVVGRPITAADDPVEAYERCVAEFID